MNIFNRPFVIIALATLLLYFGCDQKVCPPTQPVTEIKKGSNDVLATVKGETITDSSLRAKTDLKMKFYQAELNVFNAEKAEHDQLRESLNSYIQDKLLNDA